MTKKEYYQYELGQADDWPAYLLEHSNLPGPRANLELMQAYVEMGSEKDFIPLLDHTPDIAPVDSPEEFLAFCGTVGLGELIANGLREYLPDLRRQASDPRWRIREAVAMALQIIGRSDFYLLGFICDEWVAGNLLEQRAAVAGICEPSLLKDPNHANMALDLLDKVTRLFSGVENRNMEEFNILCKGLAYCWSVAVVAHPERGKPMFEELARSEDPDIKKIVKANLKNNRLIKMDPEWVGEILSSI
jgi:hypothetical protein